MVSEVVENNMTKEEAELKYRPESKWFGRSLENYKSMQANVAASKGVTKELREAKTLTQARKVVYGLKAKNTK